jgi:site-specific DNA-methyltransferase (adenine-specific)
MASDEGDIVFDPFGGSGTTYIVAEIKNRRWIGIELGPTDDIVDRFRGIDEEAALINKIRRNYNSLFTEDTLKMRIQNGLWTCESVRNGGRKGKLPGS